MLCIKNFVKNKNNIFSEPKGLLRYFVVFFKCI